MLCLGSHTLDARRGRWIKNTCMKACNNIIDPKKCNSYRNNINNINNHHNGNCNHNLNMFRCVTIPCDCDFVSLSCAKTLKQYKNFPQLYINSLSILKLFQSIRKRSYVLESPRGCGETIINSLESPGSCWQAIC